MVGGGVILCTHTPPLESHPSGSRTIGDTHALAVSYAYIDGSFTHRKSHRCARGNRPGTPTNASCSLKCRASKYLATAMKMQTLVLCLNTRKLQKHNGSDMAYRLTYRLWKHTGRMKEESSEKMKGRFPATHLPLSHHVHDNQVPPTDRDTLTHRLWLTFYYCTMYVTIRCHQPTEAHSHTARLLLWLFYLSEIFLKILTILRK